MRVMWVLGAALAALAAAFAVEPPAHAEPAPADPAISAPAADAPAAKPAAEGATPALQDAAAPPPAEPTLLVDINLATQRMTVSEDGIAKFTWAISSGRSGYRTPTGTYRPQWTAKMWYSRKYDWSPMPNAVFFHKGFAVHGTYATGMLGRPASHGCVRLAPSNAATLYKLVGKHGKAMTRIVVHGTPRFNEPAVAARDGGYRAASARRRSTQSWDVFSAFGPGFVQSGPRRAPQFVQRRYYPSAGPRRYGAGYGYAVRSR